jgi:hypothetical protein
MQTPAAPHAGAIDTYMGMWRGGINRPSSG